MPQYEYHCANCNYHFEENRAVEYRNAPCVLPCPKCKEYYVNRVISANSFVVKQGKLGNSENGYTDTGE